MFKNFEDMLAAAKKVGKNKTICIAGASGNKILHLVQEIVKCQLCRLVLVGNEEEIRNWAAAEQVDLADVRIIHEPNAEKIGVTAVSLVSSGEADIYVKGKLNSSDFLRSVLNKEVGLRTGSKLSVLTAYDVPGQKKLFFLTDGGMVVAPNLEDKAMILRNAVGVLHRMGLENPKIALLSANEKVSAGMQSSVDADALCKMAQRGELPEGIYEGPMAFDVAMRPDAAKEKGIESQISGDVDLFLVPNIETGNCLGKSIAYFAGGKTAGIVIGAARPVVMSSRAASVAEKIASVAWALLADSRKN